MAGVVRDHHGFAIEMDDVSADQQTVFFSKAYAVQVALQQRRWNVYRAKTPYFHLSPEPSDELKKLCRLGVPHDDRPEVWMLVSGAQKQLLARPGYYQDLVERYKGKSSADTKQIERDLSRTFPSHIKYRSEEGQEALRRVLEAFCRHKPEVGYCQSMNFVAGFLLLFTSEEQAFWLLTVIVEDKLPTGYYSRGMVASTTDTLVLDDLLAARRPRLHAHLAKNHVASQIVVSDWFLAVFTTALPSETALRVLDAFFYEGSKVLFRVALALFIRNESDLLKMQDPGMLLARMKGMSRSTLDPDALLKTAFKGLGTFSIRKINELRAERMASITSEVNRRGSDRWEHGVVEDETRHKMQLFMLGEDNTASPSTSLKRDVGADEEPVHVTGFRVRLGG